jgi:hypothetical protein
MDTDRNSDGDMGGDTDGDWKGTRTRTRTRMGTGIQEGTETFLWCTRPWGTTFEFENNLRYESRVYIGLIDQKHRPKISCYSSFKILSVAKNTWQ